MLKPTEDRPVCCGRPMASNGRAESGRTRYLCSQCKMRTTASGESQYANADIGYDTQQVSQRTLQIREAVREGSNPNAFELYLKPRLKVDTKFISPNEPFMLAGVDHSQHGHRGVNGARGSARAFANTTHKLTIAHAHSARIVKSVHQVGKSCAVLEYESGLSSHTLTHCLQYQNGKRTLIDIQGTAWRATNSADSGGLGVSEKE